MTRRKKVAAKLKPNRLKANLPAAKKRKMQTKRAPAAKKRKTPTKKALAAKRKQRRNNW
jgi:hypothetical protein